MGLFDKIVKDVSNEMQKAVNKAVEKEAEKKVDEAVEKAKAEYEEEISSARAETESATKDIDAEIKEASDEWKKAADDLNSSLEEAKKAMAEADEAMSKISKEDWEKANSTLERMALDALKDKHICPKCDEAFKGEFCPKCGGKLSEKTALEMGLCPKCGKQEMPGTEFCTACGAKLPYKEFLEEVQVGKDREVLDRFRRELPQFPVWECGGSSFDLSELEEGRYFFGAWFDGDEAAAQKSVKDYQECLKRNGFVQAGKYPHDEHLYKMIDGVCYHADTEHVFEGDADSPSVYFLKGDEPPGGFDYVKPEPAKKSSKGFGSLFR